MSLQQKKNRESGSLASRLADRRGQSLILAVIILFLLVFLGVVFIAVVTRNMFRAGRSSDMLRVEQLAKAGIEYADFQLTRSEEGADWRPIPEYPDWDTPADIEANIRKDDPDHQWISLPIQKRFSRINFGEGRFLLRVSYEPDRTDPMSKYIKIESIGRMGIVDPNDPTTFTTSSGKQGLRVQMTAYKPIGLTDYARFITNKEKRATPVSLGARDADTIFGRPSGGGREAAGGPIRVNGNLVWNGNVTIYLRGSTYRMLDAAADPGVHPIDHVAVAGKIAHADDTTVQLNSIVGAAITSGACTPSEPSEAFNSHKGFYRDGHTGLDVEQRFRNVRRIEPPIIDAIDNVSSIMRYRQLTRNSGEWRQDTNTSEWYNTGRYGWGDGIYIDNWNDVQRESETIFGGYTLRADWMKPNNEMSPYWRGPYYVPPGVQITLNPIDTNGDKEPDITLTRTDVGSNGRKYVWLDENGQLQVGWGQTIVMKYPQNGVIYAEGNIRIKGMLPPDKQLTIVSGATIYVEGNLLKNRLRGTGDVDPYGAITLLARDYVCVNTTQFVSLLTETGPTAIGSDSETGEPPFHLIISPEPESNFRTHFSFGPPDPGNNYLMTPAFQPFVLARHAGQYGSSYINLWVNRGGYAAAHAGGLYNFYQPGSNAPWPSLWPYWVYGLADTNCGGKLGVGIGTSFEYQCWELPVDTAANPDPIGRVTNDVGYLNYLEIGLDHSTFIRNNYLLSGFTIQPMDVVIEAMIYAQNKSFFIIPGPWFNPNPEDTKSAYDASPLLEEYRRPLVREQRFGQPIDPRLTMFPFYGQPLDIKLTINGAVTENLPASVGDVSEWMAKWSNIPEFYGSSRVRTKHFGEGITFIYDEILGCPRVFVNSAWESIRQDEYERPLPVTPRLPVSPSLIYYGEAT